MKNSKKQTKAAEAYVFAATEIEIACTMNGVCSVQNTFSLQNVKFSQLVSNAIRKDIAHIQ